MFDFLERYIVIITIALMLVFTSIWVWTLFVQSDYLVANNCVLIAIESSTIGVSTSGNVMVFAGKRSYKCDNGITITI